MRTVQTGFLLGVLAAFGLVLYGLVHFPHISAFSLAGAGIILLLSPTFIMEDFLGAGFFHLLLGPLIAGILASAGGIVGKGLARLIYGCPLSGGCSSQVKQNPSASKPAPRPKA